MIDNNINRRSTLKIVSSSAIGLTGFAGTALGSSSSNNELEKKTYSVSQQKVAQSLRTRAARTALFLLNSPQVNRQQAKGTKILLDGDLLSRSVQIPTEVGKLTVVYHNGSVEIAVYDLERAEVSPYQRKSISGAVGWPEETTAHLRVSPKGEANFNREPSRIEKRKLNTAISSKAELPEDALYTATTKPGSHSERGEYTVRTRGTTYIVDSEFNNVRTVGVQTPVTAMGSCGGGNMFACLYDVKEAAGYCSLGVAVCAGSNVGAPACILALMHTCLPHTALAAISGSCATVADCAGLT